jgi:hypothetical protein
MPYDAIIIQEHDIKQEIVNAFEKDIYLKLTRASFYRNNFVCDVCYAFFSSKKFLINHKCMHDVSLSDNEVDLPRAQAFQELNNDSQVRSILIVSLLPTTYIKYINFEIRIWS